MNLGMFGSPPASFVLEELDFVLIDEQVQNRRKARQYRTTFLSFEKAGTEPTTIALDEGGHLWAKTGPAANLGQFGFKIINYLTLRDIFTPLHADKR